MAELRVSTEPLSPLAHIPGFVADTTTDRGVASHYGDPLAEQRATVRSVGFVDRGNRGVLTVTGVDRLSWLHSLTSQHLAALTDGDSVEALILSPHGHVEHDLWVDELGAIAWLDVEPDTATTLKAYLDSMRFMLRVEVEDRSAEFAVLTVLGPDAPRLLADVTSVPERSGRVAAGTGAVEGGWVRRADWPGQDGGDDLPAYDLLVPRDSLVDLVGTLRDAKVRPAGMLAYDALRVEHLRPRLHHETDHRTIPHEVGWIGPAVHLDKGCYRGQETVARVHNLGRPPRRLVQLQVDGSLHSLPERGDAVWSAGRQVGFVTTAALHHEDGPIAMALLKRNVPDGTEVELRGEEQIMAALVDHGLAV